jgi:hypothetical protein
MGQRHVFGLETQFARLPQDTPPKYMDGFVNGGRTGNGRAHRQSKKNEQTGNNS